MDAPASPARGPLGALTRWLRSVAPDRHSLKDDTFAGLPGAISGVPDGMAASVLAGVNPIYGLYASAVGPIVGGLAASTRLMVITTTSAAALAAGSALSGVTPADRPGSLFLLTLLAGAAMVAAGVFRLGRYTRFVSHSVMIGFLTGVAINIICGQIPDLLGVSSEGSFPAAKAFNALIHPSEIDVASLLVGLSALVIIVALNRTRLSLVSTVIALLVPTIVVLVAGLDSVELVEDVGTIPNGVPLPHLPELRLLTLDLVVGALAVAAIVLVQGSGVAEASPNPDGSPSDANRNFFAQGVANVASGLFHGQPVGGSVGRTALNLAAGARTRWAAILSGLWMLVILAVFSGAVGNVAMPTLAAVLIYAAVRALRLAQIRTILKTGSISQVALVSTFVATLLLPVAIAVGIGVAFSLLLQLNRDALDLAVVQLSRDEQGRVVEAPAPATLPDETVTVLDVYGSLFYAGAKTLQARLPDPTGSYRPAVVLRLRGRTSLGSTCFEVLADYADRLGAVGGRLYLSGVDPHLIDVLGRTGRVSASGPIRAFEATSVVGESSAAAASDADHWLITRKAVDEA